MFDDTMEIVKKLNKSDDRVKELERKVNEERMRADNIEETDRIIAQNLTKELDRERRIINKIIGIS